MKNKITVIFILISSLLIAGEEIDKSRIKMEIYQDDNSGKFIHLRINKDLNRNYNYSDASILFKNPDGSGERTLEESMNMTVKYFTDFSFVYFKADTHNIYEFEFSTLVKDPELVIDRVSFVYDSNKLILTEIRRKKSVLKGKYTSWNLVYKINKAILNSLVASEKFILTVYRKNKILKKYYFNQMDREYIKRLINLMK